ncbi:hypothetical protein JHN59_11465 [Streptomyces sp. MBT49]|uniref:hypothetical protein n=1 Tax=unclassified Streptomyces TaxID=2593676 RepID=UPI00190B2F29|nr:MULTISPECIES: hypothetical protein [unclassified Streptomyces]MBK3625453.1 hypothetical protein [Streptomyces sp. MBT49]MBK3633284.1 hypothetical protein [Streptomyces sp. MBT97]
MTAGVRDSRPYCSCVVVQNYGYDAAAEKLGIKRQWLEDNVGRLPRQKFGKNEAVFCDCELRLIQAMYTVAPAAAEGRAPEAQTTATVPDIRSIKPSRARRRTAVV